MQKSDPIPRASERELVITRIFDLPRDLVWRAWTDPKHIQRWWGPKGVTSPICINDFRVGGRYLYCMRSPEGQEFWTMGVYLDIAPVERIVHTDSFCDADGHVVPASTYGLSADFPLETLLTEIFEDLGGKTRFTLRQSGVPAGTDSDSARQGWNEALDRIVEVINRGDLS